MVGTQSSHISEPSIYYTNYWISPTRHGEDVRYLRKMPALGYGVPGWGGAPGDGSRPTLSWPNLDERGLVPQDRLCDWPEAAVAHFLLLMKCFLPQPRKRFAVWFFPA